jgi:hypothetical protein
MKYSNSKRNERRWFTRATTILVVQAAVAGAIGVAGCAECLLFFADTIDVITVRGYVVNAETLEGLDGAALGGVLFTDGETTATTSALKLNGEPNVRLTEADGRFAVGFGTGGPACRTPLGPPLPRRLLPDPDEVEIVVAVSGCEERFRFEVNEANFVDPTAPDDELELREPIVVPACQADSSGNQSAEG